MKWIERLAVSKRESRKASQKIQNNLAQEQKRQHDALIQRAIQQDAYFLWESDGRPEGKQDYYWQRATERMQDTSFRLRALKRLRGSASGVNVWRRFINWWEKTPVERGLETFVADLKNLAFLELLGLVANITIIISLGTYLFTEKQRRDAEIFNAWQTITSADGTGGNGGRRRALEFLNASPANLFNDYGGAHWRRRFPWICVPLTQVCPLWRREPLDGLDVSNAYLAGIELPNVSLTRATLTETDLRGANLFSANLRKADLFAANLQEALLLTTDLRQTRQLTTEQLMGANPPLLCNVALPSDMEKVDPNRDCDELPQVWSDRYPISLETAQSIVNGAQQKQWE